MTAWAWSFDRMSLPATVIAGLAGCVAYFLNAAVISHNFLHTPWFRSPCLNRIFAVVNSANTLVPFSFYACHHRSHHRHNNSLADPSSTYHHGNAGRQQGWISYCALGLVRARARLTYREMYRKQGSRPFCVEAVVAAGVVVFWFVLSWKFVVMALVPEY